MGGINFYGWTHSLNTKNMNRDQYNNIKHQLKGQTDVNGNKFNKFELKKLVNDGKTQAVEQYLNQFGVEMKGAMGLDLSLSKVGSIEELMEFGNAQLCGKLTDEDYNRIANMANDTDGDPSLIKAHVRAAIDREEVEGNILAAANDNPLAKLLVS